VAPATHTRPSIISVRRGIVPKERLLSGGLSVAQLPDLRRAFTGDEHAAVRKERGGRQLVPIHDGSHVIRGVGWSVCLKLTSENQRRRRLPSE
jgi:hypothetical protein